MPDMKSKINNIIPITEVPASDDLLTIEITSWNEVIKPYKKSLLDSFNEMYARDEEVITDEVVEILNIPNVANTSQLDTWLIDQYTTEASELKYYNEILPYLMTYYYKNSDVEYDLDELEAYKKHYIDELNYYADNANKTLEAYLVEDLNLDLSSKSVEEVCSIEASEAFVFRLLARTYYDMAGLSLDELAYDEFIQHFVLHYRQDEIEMRANLPYNMFKEQAPEIYLNKLWLDYFRPQIKFQII